MRRRAMRVPKEILPVAPELSSRDLNWRGGAVQVFQLDPPDDFVVLPGFPALQILCLLGGGARVRFAREGDIIFDGALHPNDLVIGSRALTGTTREVIWDRPLRVINIMLDVSLLAKVTKQAGIKIDDVKLSDHFGVRDALIERAANELEKELTVRESRSRLHAEELLRMISVHLLRRYYTKVHPNKQSAAGKELPKRDLARVSAYIRKHLDDDITLEDMAAEVDLSVSYFSRLFRGKTGQAPYEFVIEKRMERARELLLEDQLSVMQVALAVGYESPSHFTKQFKNHTGGLTPSAFRKQTGADTKK